jgi:drug/metabolite transporter (DMT)-like permease
LGKVGGAIGLTLGVIGIVLGTLYVVGQQSSLERCQDHGYRDDNVYECTLSPQLYNTGLAISFIGVGFVILGAIMLATATPVPRHLQFVCLQCSARMTYKSSPTNCYSCGAPIDWDKAKAPQK